MQLRHHIVEMSDCRVDMCQPACSVVDAPWRTPGADPSDYFNYGLTANTWKQYCDSVRQFQLEFTMQKKIEVYDREGKMRSNDPDLPPELAAALAKQKHRDTNHAKLEAHPRSAADNMSLVRCS